jgi:leucyl/phenylalanyl-tRNA--protein transferase
MVFTRPPVCLGAHGIAHWPKPEESAQEKHLPCDLGHGLFFSDRCLQEDPSPWTRGTWITAEMRSAYCHLHDLGHAHSVEVWSGDELVGGLYGVSLGHLFAGESMFSRESDASKTGLVWLVRQLQQWGFGLIDAQVTTDTLTRMGAVERSREAYLASIAELVAEPGRVGPWSFDEGFHPLLD